MKNLLKIIVNVILYLILLDTIFNLFSIIMTSRNRRYHGNTTEKYSIEQALKVLEINSKHFRKLSKEQKRQELKKAFRKRAQETHPDHGGSSQDFQKVKSAYEFAHSM